MSARLRLPLAIAALGLGLALAWCAPVLARPDALALGSPEVDLPAGLWTLWWATQPDAATLVNHPVGGVRFELLTPVSLAIARALAPRFILAHNLACGLSVLVAAAGGGLWGHRLGGPRGGVLGATALATSPALGAALLDGTGEFTWLGLLALSMWAFDRLAEPSPGRQQVVGMGLAGLLLAATTWACWYYGLAAGLGAAVMAGVRGERRRALPRTALAGLLGLLLVLPALAGFRSSDLEPERQRGSGLVEQLLHGAPGPEPDHDASSSPMAPRTQLVGPGDQSQVPWALGLGIAAAFAAWRSPRAALPLAAAGGVGLVLSLGSTTEGGLPLPLLPVNRLLSWYGLPLHLPFHLGALTTCALVGLAARGAREHLPLAVGAALLPLASLVLPGGPLPLPRLVVPRPPALVALADQEGAVLDLPTVLSDEPEVLDDEALRQVVHGRPIPRFPVFPTSLQRTEGIRMVRQTALVRALQQGSAAAPATDDLRALGYRWVVLDLARAPHLAPVLEGWLGSGAAGADAQGLVVYDLQAGG